MPILNRIPKGGYCYELITHIQTDKGFIRKVKYCPFWYGSRPDGGCMLYGWDPALGDACKACGINDSEAEDLYS